MSRGRPRGKKKEVRRSYIIHHHRYQNYSDDKGPYDGIEDYSEVPWNVPAFILQHYVENIKRGRRKNEI